MRAYEINGVNMFIQAKIIARVGVALGLASLCGGTAADPAHTCNVRFLDRQLKIIDGPLTMCPRKLDVRHGGMFDYARIGAHVYWLKDETLNETGSCMIGVACMPSFHLRKRTFRTMEFIELEGAVDFDHFDSYLDGRFQSDGKAVFSAWERVARVSPPLSLGALRRYGSENMLSNYVSDGRWVLYGHEIVAGADAASFQLVGYTLFDDAWARNPKPPALYTEFGRDRRAVYFKSMAVPLADPASFMLGIYVTQFSGPATASDRHHAWRIGRDSLEEVNLDADQLRAQRR